MYLHFFFFCLYVKFYLYQILYNLSFFFNILKTFLKPPYFMWPVAYRVFSRLSFLPFFFFFFLRVNSNLTWVYCSCTVYVLKNIKNRSHDTIYTIKNYFVTVFSVFSFQFSATISSIQTEPIYINKWKSSLMTLTFFKFE